MKWRKRLQGKDEPERPFARRWAYETLKESGGVLLQNLGLLAGTVAGVISNKLGMPVHTAVTTGLIVGQAAGMAAKGFINALVDEVRESEAKPDDSEKLKAEPAVPHQGKLTPPTTPGLLQQRRRSPLERFGLGSTRDDSNSQVASSTGSYLQQLRRILDEIETQQAKLANVANAMRASQLGLAQLLAGGRQDRTQEIYTWAELSRSNIEEAAVLTHQATRSLGAYVSNL